MRNRGSRKALLRMRFASQYFKCDRCGYAEPRLILGDISSTPCPNCGYSPMKRVK